jgi:hypothetical protein
MVETGYGSDEFLRACRIDAACREIVGTGPRATWDRLQAGSRSLSRYHRSLPLTDLRLTPTPAGRMIAEHFAIRDGGRLRYSRAQGVLPLPADFAAYLRGRSRQAVRTNVGHARRAGQTVISCAVDDWAPGLDDSRRAAITPGPVERWMVQAADGEVVADSIVSVDREVALLHGLISFTENARWLLHTAIVERLCGECSMLIANGDDAYRLAPGNQHFQRLLGYRISRLRVSLGAVAPAGPPAQPAALSWPPGDHSCGIPLVALGAAATADPAGALA